MAFKKGQSGNPGGRPIILQDVKKLAREKTTEAIEALVLALKKPGERVHAATVLLAYGYGKPQQTVNVRRINSVEDLDDDELAILAATKEDQVDGTRH